MPDAQNPFERPSGGAPVLALPVVPLPAPEERSELEGRWAAANFIFALAIGAVLAREAHRAGFRWWFLNVPVALLVAAVGSLGGSATSLITPVAWPLVLGRTPSRGERLWARLLGSFMAAGWTFDQAMTRLEGHAVWPGTYARWWTIAWPLGALMLFVNATEVQAGGRLTAERRALTSERASLRNHYALDADLRQLAKLQSPFTFVYFDLDGFKQVNDKIGHEAGDEVLAETGVILSGLESQLEVVAYHLHGDEFAFLVPGHEDKRVHELVRRVFSGVRAIGVRRSTDLGATFGAARNELVATDPDAVRHSADAQMRRAKDEGKRRLAFASGEVVVLAS
ncbi:MAG: GGDEF domain-containing protein [Chloroflexota bacterium]|nr:GGDEF domain-containing protein [Chloroflexota bacterium]